MKTRRSLLLSVTTMVTAFAAVLPLANPAEARRGPKTAEVTGTITAVSGTTAPATVTLTNSRGSITLNATSTTLVKVGEENTAGTVADLQVGFAAQARYEVNTGNIQLIHVANELQARGRVVVTADGQIGLDTNFDGTADLTLGVDAETEIKVGAGTLTLAQLALLQGLVVDVEYTPGTPPVANEIRAVLPRANEVAGTVTAVDAVAGTLTVQLNNGQLVTFTVPVGAQVNVQGRSVTLSQVVVGDRVVVQFVTGTTGNVALRVNVLGVRPQKAVGTVTAVDVTAGTVTVVNRGETTILTLTPETDLRINGRRVTLAQLAAALTTNNGRTVKVNATYFVRGGVNVATDLQVNVNGRGRS